MELNPSFWKGRSVFLTGHTGFKGGWLALWLSELGAKVYGYALEPSSASNMYTEAKLAERIAESTVADIRNFSALDSAVRSAKPSVVIHMAAQPLVRESYRFPVETFATNLMGTVNLLEAVRRVQTVCAVVNVTTDKSYESREWVWPYRESDRLGGNDPYSASKACAELATVAYRKSFLEGAGIQIATARAGNVIGGGDWSRDRLIPDVVRATSTGEVLSVRSPNAVRPWQHVLEPLSGYLLLCERLATEGTEFAGAWNFGPDQSSAKSVSWVLDRIGQKLPGIRWEPEVGEHPHETAFLKLDSTKAKDELRWCSRWSLDESLDRTVAWFNAWRQGEPMDQYSLDQIRDYLAT